MAKKNNSKKKTNVNNDSLLMRIVLGIVFSTIVIIASLRYGFVGILLNNTFRYVFGEFFYITVATVLFLSIYYIFLNKKFYLGAKTISGIVVLNISMIFTSALIYSKGAIGLEVITNFFSKFPNLLSEEIIRYGGGLIGAFLYALSSSLFDKSGTIVFIIALFVISAVLIIPLSAYSIFFEKTSDYAKELNQSHSESKAKRAEERRLKLEQMAIEENKRLEAEAMEEEARKAEEKLKELELKKMNESYTLQKRKNSIFIDYVSEDEVINEEPASINVPKSVETPSNTIVEEKPRVLKENRNKNYKFPSINVFEAITNNKSSSINKTSAELKGKKVIEILKNFGIDATLINTHIGPSVTKFEIKPDSSVKVNKIQTISDNIKMELAARDIRIESPIPGRSAVGIEIPNVEPIPVRMQELIKQIPQSKKDNPLLFVLGKDLMGKLVTCEINKMPHLLIAGATGSGKSVCINSIISSLLYRSHPDEVKLVLVDPKKVEFTPYHDVPHLLWPVITDSTMASNMLKKVVVMMEARFDLFADAGVRNIKTYNDNVDSYNASNPENKMERMPFIVVIIDELADLMMVAGKEVEASIQRITQLARAAGIHLIVATQRPSTDVITGIIKSNIPSRISFSVASSIDSRTILDQAGAERLLGNGDMLYYPQGETSPIRLQGVFVTDNEVKNITSYVKSQAKPNYDDSYFEFLNINNASGPSNSRAEKDSIYEEVKEYVIDVQKASTSLLQRRFGIGYNRAAGLIEALEENGIVGPAQGSKPREVYMKKEESADE